MVVASSTILNKMYLFVGGGVGYRQFLTLAKNSDAGWAKILAAQGL